MIAERWHIPPPDVDEYPWYEIANEIEMLNLEAQLRAEDKRKSNG